MLLPMFKIKLVRILSNILNSTSKFGIEIISAFPLQGYHTEKKPYISSNDLNCQYYYRKVALSVNNYNPISDNEYNNSLFFSALSRDCTLVLTWDIETYSSQKIGEVPNTKYEEDVVFMICMTVHWKNDPEPLKQICLINS
ncbi:17895_t:CDS:2 [Funneliformis geosporum]|uniref:17895_t:CDS:1 n=1 Tax=Funneliformis geosporum TaxID=1117311 RepID=A0A9W4T5D4_9GLOM|nr:17895_t:CDS:2 [Funneliformis geosporum]